MTEVAEPDKKSKDEAAGIHKRMGEAVNKLQRDPRQARLILALAMVLATALYLYMARNTTFFFDEWDFVLGRPSWSLDTLLEAHNGHLSLVPVLIFKLNTAIFGLADHLPYLLTLLALHLTCVGLLFAYVRRRLPLLVALAISISLLFLGSAWQNTLWPFQIGFLSSIAAGLGMLLALDRQDLKGDIAASVLLGVSLASAGIGVVFTIAAAIDVIWRRDRLTRQWVVTAPALLYFAWYLAYGSSQTTRENLFLAPQYAADMAASAFGGIIGLGFDWGRSLAVVAVVALIYLIVRSNRLTRAGLIALSIPIAFWVLTGLSRADLGEPESPRYIYLGAIGIFIVAAEFVRRLRFQPAIIAVIWVVLVGAVFANLEPLRNGGKSLRETSQIVRAELASVEIAQGIVKPGFKPDDQRMPQVFAGEYLTAVSAHGSPAYTVDELVKKPEIARSAADEVLVRALGVDFIAVRKISADGTRPKVLTATNGTTKLRGSCVLFQPRGGGELDLQLAPPGVLVANKYAGNVEIRLRRFADEFPDSSSITMLGRASRVMRLPSGGLKLPWIARFKARGSFRVCGVEAKRDRQ